MKKGIFILEDDPIIAQDLAEIIAGESYTIIDSAYSAEEALSILKIKFAQIDLILCDIALSGKKTGIEFCAEVNELYQIPFVYLSSFSDSHTLHLVKNTHPAGFLVKPIHSKTLITTIEIALNNTNIKEPLTESIQNSNALLVKTDGKLIKVAYDDIVFAEAYDNYCYVYTTLTKYLLPITLKAVTDKLNHSNFHRIHRSYLININKIQSIDGTFLLINNVTLPMGKKYRSELLKLFNTL